MNNTSVANKTTFTVFDLTQLKYVVYLTILCVFQRGLNTDSGNYSREAAFDGISE